MWDYSIEDEPLKQRTQRLMDAKQLCLTCPLRADCDAHYRTVVSQNPYGAVGGVWGGRVYADKTGIERFDDAPAAA
ncbi:WhiB family transcriptional regulator [Nocardia sp. CY41]|uniref:WhiB family transcriptional regulator n=1 Tax=Nocardia sp. CY41 TaxID=2608686 RepID=UPI0013581FEA|nr:WhiB family transcriptional regulator [Nocardia sp. CY41]